MVADAYRRWSLITRGSNCKALTGKILVLWIGGCLWEVVAYEEVVSHGGSNIFTNSNSTWKVSSVTRGRLEAHRFTSVLETVQCDPLEIKLVFFFLIISVRKTHIRTRSSEVIVRASDLQLKKTNLFSTFRFECSSLKHQHRWATINKKRSRGDIRRWYIIAGVRLSIPAWYFPFLLLTFDD